MWDLIKSIPKGLIDTIIWIFARLWDILVWLISHFLDFFWFLFKHLINFFITILQDLVINHPISLIISLIIIGIIYYFWNCFNQKNYIEPEVFYKNPKIILLSIPFVTAILGLFKGTSKYSIIINIKDSVVKNSPIQINPNEGNDLLGIPIGIWIAIIGAAAIIIAALIAIKKSNGN